MDIAGHRVNDKESSLAAGRALAPAATQRRALTCPAVRPFAKQVEPAVRFAMGLEFLG